MKQTLLPALIVFAFTLSVTAQKKSQRTTAYAITSQQKGSSNWTEVKLVDVITGEEIQSVYQSSEVVPVLNARTGKAVVKKDAASNLPLLKKDLFYLKDLTPISSPAKGNVMVFGYDNKNAVDAVTTLPVQPTQTADAVTPARIIKFNSYIIERRPAGFERTVKTDNPFATNSAACAYDKKHDRLYYTPMGINQLRYIDLKSKTLEINYFEDESFGVVGSLWDTRNQVTRMVIGADHNGYALTNNGEHLIKFTTNKKAEITDLGSLTDDAANGAYSVHSSNGYGGDMVADDKGALYLITAGRAVFKIDVDSKIATYKGAIQGLPRGFSTNGAVVESGTNIIVSSATFTSGYYMFDLNTMQAQKVSTGESVFNASDLANANLISEKKKKKDDVKADEKTEAVPVTNNKNLLEVLKQNNIAVYPNPAAMGSSLKISFADQPRGNYTIQLMDISGKLIDTRQVNIGAKMQVEDYKLPSLVGKGSYLIKVLNESGKIAGINTIVVQ